METAHDTSEADRAYPQPTDTEAFEKVYQEEHVPLAIRNLQGMTRIVATKIMAFPQGAPPFHRVAEINFPSIAGAPTVRKFGGRKGDAGERDEDLLGWLSCNHDRRRGKLYFLMVSRPSVSPAMEHRAATPRCDNRICQASRLGQ